MYSTLVATPVLPAFSTALLKPVHMLLQTKVASKARHPHWGETFKLPIMVRILLCTLVPIA